MAKVNMRMTDLFFKDFIYLYEKESMSRVGGRGEEAEGEAASPLSRELDQTQGSIPKPWDHDLS